MVRVFIILASAALSYGVLMPGAPGGGVPLDSAASAAVSQPPALGLPELDLLSLGIGLLVGFMAGWMWHLPWRTVPERARHVAFRSMRGVGFMGLAMAAAAILLFY